MQNAFEAATVVAIVLGLARGLMYPAECRLAGRVKRVPIKIERGERFTDIGPGRQQRSQPVRSTSASISPADTRNPSPAKSGAET